MFHMGGTITVGGVDVEPGSRGVGCLTLPDFFADGQSVEIPFVVVNGASPGPCLYVQVAQHGSEVQGLDATGGCWRIWMRGRWSSPRSRPC